MAAIIILFAGFFVLGGTAFIFACVFTKNVKSAWLRHLVRALIASIAFTPTILPAPELHGSLPMPAAIALVVDLEWPVRLTYACAPLVASALLYWSVAMLASYLIKKYPADQ